jgi:hypothetical protein
MSAANLFATKGVKPRTKYPGKWWVRVKPYNPNTGAVVRRIRVRKLGPKGIYAEKDGWASRALNRAQVRLLLDTHTDPHDPSTPCVFDVCTFEEAMAMDIAAKTKVKAAGGRRDASDALDGVFTTADLPERHTERPRRGEPEHDDADAMAERREQQEPDDTDADDTELDADLDFDDME